VTKVANELSCSRVSVYGLIYGGHLEAIRIGRTYRVATATLQDYVEELTKSPYEREVVTARSRLPRKPRPARRVDQWEERVKEKSGDGESRGVGGVKNEGRALLLGRHRGLCPSYRADPEGVREASDAPRVGGLPGPGDEALARAPALRHHRGVGTVSRGGSRHLCTTPLFRPADRPRGSRSAAQALGSRDNGQVADTSKRSLDTDPAGGRPHLPLFGGRPRTLGGSPDGSGRRPSDEGLPALHRRVP